MNIIKHDIFKEQIGISIIDVDIKLYEEDGKFHIYEVDLYPLLDGRPEGGCAYASLSDALWVYNKRLSNAINVSKTVVVNNQSELTECMSEQEINESY